MCQALICKLIPFDFIFVWTSKSSLHGYWLRDSVLFVCQPFSGFSFEAQALILCWMLCANRPYTANSLTYLCRQRATGLLGLMVLTDHTRPPDEKTKVTLQRAVEVEYLRKNPLSLEFLLGTWFDWESWSKTLRSEYVFDLLLFQPM